jgi:hypothetical protein
MKRRTARRAVCIVGARKLFGLEHNQAHYRGLALAQICARVDYMASLQEQLSEQQPGGTFCDAVQRFRSARALFVPSLKPDIVPSVAWA